MLDSIQLKHVLFLDIETVPQTKSFELLPENFQKFWEKKSMYFRGTDKTASEVYEKAGIYAEFGKIVCISVGMLTGDKNNYGIKLKSFIGDDEKEILKEFAALLEILEKKSQVIFCAHNGKEFDFPYLARRMIINSISLPKALDNSGKKPWEVLHLDTLDLWKFGDYKHYTSLDLLAAIFDIPSPKEEIDGSMIAEVYYIEHNLAKIQRYCENDVLTVGQILMRYLNLKTIKPEKIVRSSEQKTS